MSVYSGFATRQQQKKYNQYIQSLLNILFKRLLKFYNEQECEEIKFKNLLIALHDKMRALEEFKYMQPHYSPLLNDYIRNVQKVLKIIDQEDYKINKIKDSFFKQEVSQQPRINRAKINTISDNNQQFKFKNSRNHINQSSDKTIQNINKIFRKKLKTSTPQIMQRKSFYTPPKIQTKQKQKSIFQKEQQQNQFLPISEPKHQKIKIEAKQQNIQKQKRSISPRQYLRQTVMGKESLPISLVMRTKQRHQMKIK